MRFFELAYCCRLYGQRSRFDAALLRLQRATANHVDLADRSHAEAVVQWLRDWGIRTLRKEDHSLTVDQLMEWHASVALAVLPDRRNPLHALSPSGLAAAGEAYSALAGLQAAWRRSDRGLVRVGFGATAAAKVMYAIRPSAFVPWDGPIRKHYGWGDGGAAYVEALERARESLSEAAGDARHVLATTVSVDDLPRLVGRPESAPPKLVDEHDWARITNGFQPPSPKQLAAWLSWASEALAPSP